MKITGDWISNPHTQAVMNVLDAAGVEAFFVGGCVRNALLQAPVTDIDIATAAHPEQVIEIAEAAGLRAVPTGIDHGTITVVSGHVPHEITTYREDVETFGRHAIVAYATDVSHDARRRDFTMNALYARADGTIFDPLGGIADLNARRVRFIEDPKLRIKEDYLRILRFFRFHAWYGDATEGLDADGLAASAELAEGLNDLSRERVTSEIVKLLSAPDPTPSVAAMQQAGILSHVLPGADAELLGPVVHLEGMTDQPPRAMRRLAAIAPEESLGHLRLSKVQTKAYETARAQMEATTPITEVAYRHGADAAWDAALLRAALFETPVAPQTVDDIATGLRAIFPLRAADLMPDLTGPALGQAMKRLEADWIASGFSLSRDALIERKDQDDD